MKKHVIQLAIAMFVLLLSINAGSQSKTNKSLGECGNKLLYARKGHSEQRVASPDGKRILTVQFVRKSDRGPYTRFRLQTDKSSYSFRLTGWNSEILWSNDSRYFAINQTIGGGGIGQRAYIYSAEDNKPGQLDVYKAVEKSFGSPVNCEVKVSPNTATINWLGSERVLVIAEVVPMSICQYGGTYKSYEVSLPDLRVRRTYSQIETKRLFADALGCELRDANDRLAAIWQHSRF